MAWPLRACALLLLSCAGCGLRMVPIEHRKADQLPSLEGAHPNIKILTIDNRALVFFPRSTIESEQEFSAAYHWLGWKVGRLPCVVASVDGKSEFPLMLDTALNVPMVMSVNLVEEHGLPSVVRAGRAQVSFLNQITIGKSSIRDLRVLPVYSAWEAHVLGVPVYRPGGAFLGLPVLDTFNYVQFDNVAQRVTVSPQRSFAPAAGERWCSYATTCTKSRLLAADLPLQGVPQTLVLDSAGGPHVILNRADWNAIRDRVVVEQCDTGSFPSWGGMHYVAIYTLRELEIAGIKRHHVNVLVRGGGGSPSTIGMGWFEDTTVVFDFQGKKFWCRTPPH